MDKNAPQGTLTDDDRRHIAATSQRFVNARVFRELSRIIEEWKKEERVRKYAAAVTVAFFFVAGVAAAVWILSLSQGR